MSTFKTTETVGELVTKNPGLSRIFEEEGIDFCCGGNKSLDEACQEKGVDSQEVIKKLEASIEEQSKEQEFDVNGMSLTTLVDHILETHHTYLREEFPRLDMMTAKVARVHGGKGGNLIQIREVYVALETELLNHMMKEEEILFPVIKELDSSANTPSFHCGELSGPINQMELEHDGAGDALKKLNELSKGYSPPLWACNTYRAMLDGLMRLERDLHIHIHKENNILFPRAIEMEREKGI